MTIKSIIDFKSDAEIVDGVELKVSVGNLEASVNVVKYLKLHYIFMR